MTFDENLIDQITHLIKQNQDISAWKKNRSLAPIITLLLKLNNLPKNPVPTANLARVKNQILDRIAVPVLEEAPATGLFGLVWRSIPQVLRVGGGLVSTILIVTSLVLGTAAAALESGPGQPMYPVKKIVEHIQLRLASDDSQKTNLQIKFAGERLEELERVLEKNNQGQVSEAELNKIVSETVKSVENTTAAAVNTSSKQPKPAIVTKLSDLSNKLKSASTQSEGQVKVELEKALETTLVSKEQAIKNIEQAGLRVEEEPIIAEEPPTNTVTANGKLTQVSESSVSIGTAKFLLTKTVDYVNGTTLDLKVGLVVSIEGTIKDNKTYATKITFNKEIKETETEEKSETDKTQ